MERVKLFLSPHLDDVTLSCPIYLQRSKEKNIVCTVFSEGSLKAKKLYRERRLEDLEAAKVIKYVPLHLGMLDAPFRSPFYSNFNGIVFGRAREYRETQKNFQKRLEELCDKFLPSEVIAPLAVGNHVDHRLVRDAALAVVDTNILRFYEDRPYSFVREQVMHVRGQPMAKKGSLFWKNYYRVRYVEAYADTDKIEEVRANWQSVPPFPKRLRNITSYIPSTKELQAIKHSICCYKTQLPNLFANKEEISFRYAENPERYYKICD